MSPSILAIILHLGGILKTLKDAEAALADSIQGKGTSAEWLTALNDALGLMTSGVITLPGLTQDQITAAVGDIQKALPAPAAA